MIYPESIGVVIRDAGISIASIKGSIKGFRLVRHAAYRQDPGLTLSERLDAAGRVIADFRKEYGLDSAPIFLGVSDSQVVFKEIDLPLTIKESLHSTIRYEMEKYLPIAATDVCFDLQILSEDRANGRLRVLLAAMKRESAECYFDLCRNLKGGASGIGTERTAMANCIYYLSLSKSGHRNGGQNSSLAAWGLNTAHLGEDVMQQLAVLRVRSMDAVVPFGLALTGLQKVPLRINLLRPALRRRPSRMGYYVMVGLAVVTFLSALAWGGGYWLRQRMILGDIEAELKRISMEIQKTDRIQQQAQVLEERLRELNAKRNQSTTTIEIVRELTLAIPENAWINDFILQEGRVEIYGFAQRAADLIPLIEASPIFREVAFLSTITKEKDGMEKFRIGLKVSAD